MAKSKGNVPKEETKRQRFVRLVEPRVARAVRSIQLIGNCAGSAYEYGHGDVTQIIAALDKEVQGLKQRFSGSGKVSGGFKLGQ